MKATGWLGDTTAHNAQVDFLFGRVSLGKDDLVLAVPTNAPVLANLSEKGFRIE